MRQMRLIPVLCLMAACNGLSGDQDPVDPGGAPTTNTLPPGGTITTTGSTIVPPDEQQPPGCDTVANEAEEVMTNRCAACHAQDSAAYNGFDDATDAKGLISDGWVIPNDSANSKIFIQIDAGSMPTDEPLVPEEREIIQIWIDCGAPDWSLDGAVGGVRGFIPPEALYEAALDDVNDLDEQDDSQFEDDQVNARYLSLVHLYNAGVSTEEIELFSTGLNKLVWSLTREDLGKSITPVQMDGVSFDDGGAAEDAELQVADGLGDKLLFRVDMKEFAWDAEAGDVDVWEEMLKLYPLAIAFDQEFDAAEELVEQTATRIPIMNGDWFMGNASQPPLYFDVLDMPDTIDGFLQEFGGIASLDEAVLDDADCAGMDAQETLVSNFNRVSCRFRSINGYCYASFDFADQADEQDIFAFPDQFADNEDGGEAFCSLENGMQSYLVYEAAGGRLDKAPIAVVSDFTPGSGGEVITGLSCFNCHAAGVIQRADQVLKFVLDNENDFEDVTVDFVEQTFPPNEIWDQIYADDVAFFTRSLESMEPQVDPVGTEPIYSAYRNYDDTVTFARVAAELGVPEEVLEFQIESDQDVNLQIGILLSTGKIDRGSFEDDVRDVICELELGGECDEANFCGLSSVPCVDGSVCDAQGQCSSID